MYLFAEVRKVRNCFLAAIAILGLSSVLFTAADRSAAHEINIRPVGERTLTIVSTTGQQGGQVTIPIELHSQGDEIGMTFSIVWEPLILNSPVVTLGSGVPAGGNIVLNNTEVSQGRLGILVDFTAPFAASPPVREVVKITFNISPTAPLIERPINFAPSPVPLSMGNTSGQLVSAAYQTGTITVTSSASLVTVEGRVTTPSGQNLRNAVVSMIDANDVRRVATTSSFGLFRFDDVLTGQTYTFTVASKRYRFSPKVVPVTAAIGDLDFVGLE